MTESGYDPMPRSELGQRQRKLDSIEDYYEDTWGDYRAIWMNGSNRALHFGYWDRAVTSHAESLIRMNELMAQSAGIQAGMRVLDAGCGVAGSAMWLAETVDVSVVGITISSDQMIRGRRYVRQRALQKSVTIELLDFIDTKLPESSFDIVWAQESLVHETDKEAFFKEMYRVLRPGGRIVLEDWYAGRPPRTNRERRLLRAWTDGCHVAELVPACHVVQMAESAGFQSTEIRDLRPFVQKSVRRLRQTSLFLFPLMTFLYHRGVRSSVQHQHLRGAISATPAFERGLWSIFVMVFTKDRKPSASYLY